jgi:hypothetical protein
MEDTLATFDMGHGRSVHIAPLSRQTISEAGAEHLGFDGFYLFEVDNSSMSGGIEVLAKTTSLDSALRLIDLWFPR